MQAQRDSRIEWGRWRLPLLATAVLLIILVPFLILQALSRDSLEASDAVAHTHQVEAAVNGMAVDLRETEESAMAVSLDGGLASTRARVKEGRARLAPLLQRVIDLTRDNTAQQVRIGQLKELMERRLAVAERLVETPSAEAAPLTRELVSLYPVRPLLNELLESERSLLGARVAIAQRQRLQAKWLGWTAMLAQLLLLGLVTYLLGPLAGPAPQRGTRLDARQRARACGTADGARAHRADGCRTAGADAQRRLRRAVRADRGPPGATRCDEVGDGAWQDPVVRQRLTDVLARGRELWDFEHEQRTVGGVVRTLLINARLMILPDKDDGVVLMTLSDISAQKATQQRISDLNRQLEGKVEQVSDVNRELEAFSYSVSHDLRAPLRHVAGFSDKLRRHLGEAADEKSGHYLQVIGDSAKRMSELIDDLLVYSRLGRSALRLQAVDMQSLVEETRVDAGRQREPRSRRRQPPHRLAHRAAADPGRRREHDAAGLAEPAGQRDQVQRQARRSRPSRSAMRWTTTAATTSPCATMAPVSTWPTPASCSACSSACTRRPTTPAPASAWPACAGSWPATVAGSGPRPPSTRAPPSISFFLPRWMRPPLPKSPFE